MDRVINSSKYWFLNNLNYSPNKLEIRIIEGMIGDGGTGRRQGPTVDVPSWPVEITEKSKIVDILFRNVSTFECHEGVSARPDKNGGPSYKSFRELKKSEFLDRNGALFKNRRHYAVYTEFMTIDVLSEYPQVVIQ
jgi:hypothetical protein